VLAQDVDELQPDPVAERLGNGRQPPITRLNSLLGSYS
jgi:hypothetical protein